MTNKILALDFGGTKLAAAVINAGERDWQNYQKTFSPPNASAQTDIEIIRTLSHNLLKGEKPAAIGVSFGGPVDATTGTVRLSHHVKGWENIPLQEILATEFNAPTVVDNDANVAAVGEHRFGAGQGYENLLYITVSTGVGGGWILNGKPWHGAQSMAGEIGHVTVDPAGPLCLCGKRGCVETFASGPYIAKQVKEWLQNKPTEGKILRGLVNNEIETITAQKVSEAAIQGDELAIQGISLAGWALGVGIGNVANLVNPERFLLGGGVTKAGKLLWETVQRVARETALPEVSFEIVPAALGDEAPLWGAVALAENLHERCHN
ncbi:MAG: ROK family protein [Cyanobacteria bacterium P01_H01_bin.35]